MLDLAVKVLRQDDDLLRRTTEQNEAAYTSSFNATSMASRSPSYPCWASHLMAG